jgi:hypothetical protein
MIHPSTVLRVTNPAQRAQDFEMLVADLRLARDALGVHAGSS